MATAITLKQILEEVAIRSGLGLPLTVTATTTAITGNSNNNLKGPFTASRFAGGAPIRVTAGGATTDNTYVSAYAPATGIITCFPAITTAATSVLVAYDLTMEHWDWAVQAINRVLANRTGRLQKTVLTFVPDGAMLGTVASFWTASAGTVSYVGLDDPETAGARCVQISHSAAANAVSNTIPATAGDTWEFETAIRAASDGDTATLTVRDITAGADIDVTYQRGSGTTTSRAFVVQRGTFKVPGAENTDARIAFKIAVSGSDTMIAQMATVTAYPRNASTFPLGSRVETDQHVGNFYYGLMLSSPTGPEKRTYSEPITTGGRTHHIDNQGGHFTVNFNFRPTSPVYYDEYVSEPALSAVTDTTTFPLDYVADWAVYELKKFIAQRKRTKEWVAERQSALKDALGNENQYGPATPTIVGRV